MVIGWCLLLLYMVFPLLANPAVKEKLKLEELEVVLGSMAKLPCDLVPPEDDDSVALVIWYKNDDKTPIYSLDVRDRDLHKGIHWADGDLEGRASFSSDLYQAALTLANSRGSDSGLYKCRVDFKRSPTRNSLVNVSVIVPPEDIHLEDADGTLVTTRSLGPLPEGSPLRLTCISAGGVPTPRVTWWYNLTLVDDTYDVLPDGRVQNVLTFEKTEREHLHAVLTCQALNSPFVVPKSTSVTIDLYLGPLDVRLIGDNLPMSAGSEYEVACQTSGSRPPATLTWWKSGVPLRLPAREVSSIEGNVTTSTIRLTPGREDHGTKLSCRATNPRVPDKALEASWTLDVYFFPELEVSLVSGDNTNTTQTREGTTVQLMCRVRANPTVTEVRWRHNGEEVKNSMDHQLSPNNTLSLLFVTRRNSGRYSCSARNSEGSADSAPYLLDVKYTPKCSTSSQTVYGVHPEEAVNLTCDAQGNPPVSRVWWRYGDSAPRAANVTDVTSVVLGPGDDDVIAACWGENDIGNQTVPCTFRVILANSPEPPSNCSVRERGETWLAVECAPGGDGGLPQTFVATVALQDRLVANLSSSGASAFTVTGLEPGTTYDVTVRAVNSKGSSEELALRAATTGRLLTQRRTTSSESSSSSLESTIVLGVGSFLSCIVAVSLLLGMVLALRRFRRRQLDFSPTQKKMEMVKADSCTLSDDEKNPDVVPCSTELTAVEVSDVADDPTLWQTLVVSPLPLHGVNTQNVPCMQPWGVVGWEENPNIAQRNVETQTPQNVLESVV